MNGHAEYNSQGCDILCAALSSTSQMTINGIADWIGVCVDDIIVDEDSIAGKIVIQLDVSNASNATVLQLFKSFEMFIEQLCEQYSNNVTMTRRYINGNTNN